jgi:uncharacterized protein
VTLATVDTLLIAFVKAPVPGRVKTRLATALGAHEAARLYRSMGRGVVDRLRARRFDLVIYFDPEGAEEAVRGWLGQDGIAEFLPQPPGDLGTRLRHAFDWGFRRADRVCVVGTDIPALACQDVEDAFRMLTSEPAADVVLGPARDGGYYLMGLRRPEPALFDDVPWSTDEVLDTTMRIANTLELETALLRTLIDVDSPDDLHAAARAVADLGHLGAES